MMDDDRLAALADRVLNVAVVVGGVAYCAVMVLLAALIALTATGVL